MTWQVSSRDYYYYLFLIMGNSRDSLNCMSSFMATGLEASASVGQWYKTIVFKYSLRIIQLLCVFVSKKKKKK